MAIGRRENCARVNAKYKTLHGGVKYYKWTFTLRRESPVESRKIECPVVYARARDYFLTGISGERVTQADAARSRVHTYDRTRSRVSDHRLDSHFLTDK